MTRRVLAVLPEDTRGGASQAVLRLLPGLEQSGFELELWVPRPSPLADHLAAEGRTVHGAPRHIRYSLAAARSEPPGPVARVASVARYLRAYRSFLSRGRFDLVHANTLLALPEAGLARRAGVPTLVHVHEMLAGGVRGRVAAGVAKRAELVVAVSGAAARRLAEQSVEARVVHNGVGLAPAPESRVRGRVVVGAIGTISPRKGTDLFLEVARTALARDPRLEFRLAGALAPRQDAPWARHLAHSAEAAGVDYLGRVEAQPLLRELDVLVMPSREDPFPLVVLEAMAAGVPVVAAAVDGIPEQLTAETGILVAPGSVEEMAAAVLELAGDAQRRRRIGQAARARAEREFSLERQVAGMAEAYRDAIGR